MLGRIALGMVVAFAMTGARAQSPVLALPDLTLASEGTVLSVSGRVIGVGRGEVSATLEIEKDDSGGSVKTTQSRNISVSPGSSDVVASTQVSAQDDLFLNATLTLRAGNVTIGTSSITVGGSSDAHID